MAVDYQAIRTNNERRYGTDIGRIGPMLLANRYADPMHFIFELLQNAEDAMAKREAWNGSRAVEFLLSSDALNMTHFGKMFDEEDVLGICGIGESTKDLTSIGRFGIGFKSVYALTDSPEIHSDFEHFAIDTYVWPREIPAIDLQTHQTKINLPFAGNTSDVVKDVLRGLQQLGPQTLLFLREIEEISWECIGGPSGRYLRDAEKLSNLSRKITVIGESSAAEDIDEEQWIVFSRPVSYQEQKVGYIELAFALQETEQNNNLSVSPIPESNLVVYFPTVLSTNLGFLVQGPYRTTPSRDNVPESDKWNQHLIYETSSLLVEALKEFRKLGLLDIGIFQCLPLDSSRFQDGSRFAPLFDEVRKALMQDQLLPCYKGGYAAALDVKLARTQDLRDLIDSKQLTEIFDSNTELRWLSGKIPADLTPELIRYLKNELNVYEVTPENLVTRLDRPFLENQSDEWIEKLYEFLNGQGYNFLNRLRNVPLIRLEDGSHTVAFKSSQPQAFLPSINSTNFPTVRQSVCHSEGVLAFLKSLGLDYPDPIDDVIANVLPKYRQTSPEVTEDDYRSDIERLLAAYNTDSVSRREKLKSNLREAKFVRAVDAGTGKEVFAYPNQVYQATQRLKQLFNGVSGILIVDDSIDCLRGESIRPILERTGVSRILFREKTKTRILHESEYLARLRKEQGHHGNANPQFLHDCNLRGLEPLIILMKTLSTEEASSRAALLWEALCDFQKRHGTDSFKGVYEWGYYYTIYDTPHDANFVRLLNEELWVPDGLGTLQRPQSVMFEDTKWEENPFLLTKIHFKPSVINELAREAGLELEVLEWLTKKGLTSVEKLREAGYIDDESIIEHNQDEEMHEKWTTYDGRTRNKFKSQEEVGQEEAIFEDNPIKGGIGGQAFRSREPQKLNQIGSTTGKLEFITYVGVNHEESKADPDKLSSSSRLQLEEQAVALILHHEPQLERMPGGNPGYDLRGLDPDGRPMKFVEVKAMTGTLLDRPVTLSRTQLEYARKHREKYWLYIVENAGNPGQARIVRIHNPYGKAKTFTFDRGWAAVADAEASQEFQ